jgi:hypothetical protein
MNVGYTIGLSIGFKQILRWIIKHTQFASKKQVLVKDFYLIYFQKTTFNRRSDKKIAFT